MPRLLSLLLPLSLLLHACASGTATSGPSPAAPPGIDSTTIDRHIAELADDRYGGRLPFSPGEALTLDYLESELRALGLEPGNGNSYRQEVPIVELTGHPDETITLQLPGGEVDWTFRDDYVTFSGKAQAGTQVEASELVFVGFGIVAPEYGWNDYAGIDVKGKTVVVMVNDPGYYLEDSTRFKGKEMTYYGRYVQGGQEPEKGYFYRSDHFNFAKGGVPVLYAKGGYEHRTLGKAYARKQKDEFVAKRYHQPADEYRSGDWPLGGAVQDGELLFRLGLELANGETWPRWREGSEFYVVRD